MCNISTRIDALNRQLMVVSKLQRMEEDYNVCPAAICGKNSMCNNFGKPCHCAYRALSLKEQCNRAGCMEECALYDNKGRVPCNSATCKIRRKLRDQRNLQLSEGHKNLSTDLRVLKSTNSNLKNDSIKQDFQEKHNKSDQVNLTSQFYKVHMRDKVIDTYEEKGEQTVPTKDNYRAELSVQSADPNHVGQEALSKGQLQDGIDRNVPSEDGEHYTVKDVCSRDKKIFERIQKDLLNEKEHTKDLEKKLKSLTCSLNCLKEDSEQRAACLKDALETAEEQTKVAMNLVKQSKGQAEFVAEDREKLLNEIANLRQRVAEAAHTNTSLSKERDSLKNKLVSLSEDESKRCEEVVKEVNRMKQALKEKETALSKERAEFKNMIFELTNVINIQKRRICEVTSICNNQQQAIQEKDKELLQKNNEVLEAKDMLQSKDSALKEKEVKITELEYCLCKETGTCDCLKRELDVLKENHSSEQRIKEKIIEEQNKTISKQRKLLHNSEEMVQQVASEFDQLKNELHKEKQKSKSLQITIDEADSKLNQAFVLECEKCRALTADINYLTREKQKALAIAKFASQKLHRTIKQYQSKLTYEKQQHRYMALIIERKQQEIVYLKSQVSYSNKRTV